LALRTASQDILEPIGQEVPLKTVKKDLKNGL
jgi:hypothetical protein